MAILLTTPELSHGLSSSKKRPSTSWSSSSSNSSADLSGNWPGICLTGFYTSSSSSLFLGGGLCNKLNNPLILPSLDNLLSPCTNALFDLFYFYSAALQASLMFENILLGYEEILTLLDSSKPFWAAPMETRLCCWVFFISCLSYSGCYFYILLSRSWACYGFTLVKLSEYFKRLGLDFRSMFEQMLGGLVGNWVF